jgi:tRNA(Ile2) C34 agmatinyltransferase TiaS
MPVCPRCGKAVKDLGKHLRRGRCKMKGKRTAKPTKEKIKIATSVKDRYRASYSVKKVDRVSDARI